MDGAVIAGNSHLNVRKVTQALSPGTLVLSLFKKPFRTASLFNYATYATTFRHDFNYVSVEVTTHV
jgi:hypothetical protein